MDIPFGKLADKFSRKSVLILSSVFFSVMCLGFVQISSFVGILALFVLYGLHIAAKQPVQTAFVSELSSVNYRASTIGAFRMINGLCALPASFIAGLLWTSFGKFSPFYFSLISNIYSAR
jgi:MFS family permease